VARECAMNDVQVTVSSRLSDEKPLFAQGV
jgi:hypothetical protein